MEKKETVNDRLAYIIGKEGHTVGSFARKCGLPDATVRNLLPLKADDQNRKGKPRRPSYDITVAILNAVSQPWCDANWFIMGQRPAAEATDSKRLLRIIEEQQRTIGDLQRRNGELTDRLLGLLQHKA